MKLIYMTLLFFLFCTDSNAQLLAMYQKMRQIREKDYSVQIKNDSIAAYKGNADAQYKYGLYCYLNNDINEGMDLLNKSAKQNNPNAMGVIAEILYFQRDEYHQKEAYRLFKNASALNDTLSICYLGICNYWGHGTKRNYYDAVNYFRIASISKQEYIRKLGLYYLAKCYRYGRGIEKKTYVSNLILLDFDLNSSTGQLALSNLSYAKRNRLVGLEELFTNAPSYIKSIKKRDTKETNVKDNTGNRTSNSPQYDNQSATWQAAQKAAIQAEQEAMSEPLNYEDTMLDLEKEAIDARLQRISSEIDSYKQLCSEEAKGTSSNYYHLVSIDGTEIDVCDSNQLIFNLDGIECKQHGNTVKIVAFNTSQLERELHPGQHIVTLSNGQKCEINVTLDTEFTYKVEIKHGKRINTYLVSRKGHEIFHSAAPTFGLG